MTRTPTRPPGRRADDVAGRAVLVRTGWDAHWATERYGDAGHPFVPTALAEAMVAAGGGGDILLPMAGGAALFAAYALAATVIATTVSLSRDVT